MGGLLEIVAEMRLQMLLGVSISQALSHVIDLRSDLFSQALKIWLKRLLAGQKTEAIVKNLPELTATAGRRTFMTVIERGLGGSPIDSHLQDLEYEFSMMLETAFERRMQLLPLRLLIPLTVFILPAVILLIIGPLFISLVQF